MHFSRSMIHMSSYVTYLIQSGSQYSGCQGRRFCSRRWPQLLSDQPIFRVADGGQIGEQGEGGRADGGCRAGIEFICRKATGAVQAS